MIGVAGAYGAHKQQGFSGALSPEVRQLAGLQPWPLCLTAAFKYSQAETANDTFWGLTLMRSCRRVSISF